MHNTEEHDRISPTSRDLRMMYTLIRKAPFPTAVRIADEVDISACHAYTPVRNRRSFLYLENHSLDEWFSRYKKREAVTDFPFLAPMRGFEPPTYRLGGGRSILLSYMGIWTFSQLGYCIAVSAACQPRKQFPKLCLGQERRHRLLQISLTDTGGQIEAHGQFLPQGRRS